MAVKLTTLKQVREALAEDGAVLVRQSRYNDSSFSVLRPNGQRVQCSAVADRLTWAREGKPAEVKFRDRTTLELFYVPTNR